MWILLRIIIVMAAVLGRIFGFSFRRKNFQVLSNGLEVSINIKEQKGKCVGTDIYFKTNQKIFFRLVPEIWFLKICKQLGLGSEIQLGDSEFDNLFYVASDHPSFQNLLRSSPDVVEALRKLGQQGFRRIESKGDGLLSFQTENKVEVIDPEILLLMAKVKQQFDAIVPSWSDRDRFAGIYLIAELFALALSVFSVGSIAEFYIGGDQQNLELWRLLKVGMGLGVLVILVWAALYYIFLRKSSLAPLMLFESLVGLTLGLGIGFPRLVMDANIALDKSEPTVVRAGIDGKYTKTSGGRRKTTTYYLVLNPEPNNYLQKQQLVVSMWTYSRMTQGQGVDLSIKQGYLDSPYIDEMNPTTYPADLKNPLQSTESWSESSGLAKSSKLSLTLQALAEWTAPADEMPNGTAAKGIFKEEKYGNGQLKQIEPYVDGQKQGLGKYWHQNGKSYAEIPWYKNEKHGRFKIYREDGSIEQALSYKNGKPHGLLRWFDFSGKMTHIALYNEGKVLAVDATLLIDFLKQNAGKFQ